MPNVRARWALLASYVALIYASLPFGPWVGLRLLRTGVGSWLLGPGVAVIVVVGAVVLAIVLRRRQAPPWAYAAVVVAAAGYGLAFSTLRAQRLERTHLPEYGLVAWLAWRALDPRGRGEPRTYAAAAALAAAIGLGDELLQAVVPGRYYDIRDVAMNAVGALLGTLVISAVRAGDARHKAAVPRRNAEIVSPRQAG